MVLLRRNCLHVCLAAAISLAAIERSHQFSVNPASNVRPTAQLPPHAQPLTTFGIGRPGWDRVGPPLRAGAGDPSPGGDEGGVATGAIAATGEGGGGFIAKIRTGLGIFAESMSAGDGFKQSVANAFAGEYDVAAVREELVALRTSAPCVVFTWQQSPFSKKALEGLDLAGAGYMNVRLDDPWSTGNPLRAELGKETGQSSVPSVWIGGEYVGGFDSGPSDDAPGLVTMAFRGTLLPKLRAAGALK